MGKENLRPIIEKTGNDMKLCVDAAVNCVDAFLDAYQEHGSIKEAFAEEQVHRALLWLIFRTATLQKCNVIKYAHTTLDVLLQDVLVDEIYKEVSMGFLTILQHKVSLVDPFNKLVFDVYYKN